MLETREFGALPPFTRALLEAAAKEGQSFATPGHHGGAWHRGADSGRIFCEALGRGIFAADLSDSDGRIGDVSAHDGAAGAAEDLAAQVFGAERTLFVLGGTSAANRICLSALLAPGDLVLMERSHHKSVYQGVAETGATTVYMPMLTNAAGTLGGPSSEIFSEETLRRRVRDLSPEKAKKKRPFRLACVQLVTYDGVFVSAEKILETVGPLCDYLLFDAAWAGYEIFIPFLRDLSPLTVRLGKNAPGILVTQSVHKQLAGFSQTSQIHVRDAHLAEKKRRLSADVLQESFLRHSSTSANALLFASLEMNAAMHAEAGERLWTDTVRRGVALRMKMAETLTLLRPWQPETVRGAPWENFETETIAIGRRFWELHVGETWHGFGDLPRETYFLDPCKILLRTALGGVSGLILSAFLQEHGIIPEKANFDSVLFLLTPADTEEKYKNLLAALTEFETLYKKGATVAEAIPSWRPFPHAGLTLAELCAAQFRFLKEYDFTNRERQSFLKMPKQKMTGREASDTFVSGKGRCVPLAEAPGHVALEAADAYPPGICIVPAGAVWTKAAARFFETLAAFGDAFPESAPELHGVHKGLVWIF